MLTSIVGVDAVYSLCNHIEKPQVSLTDNPTVRGGLYSRTYSCDSGDQEIYLNVFVGLQGIATFKFG